MRTLLDHSLDKSAIKTRRNPKTGDTEWYSEILRGEWRRVIPETQRDIFWLQSLAHQVEVFAPTRGDGLLVKERCFHLFEGATYRNPSL